MPDEPSQMAAERPTAGSAGIPAGPLFQPYAPDQLALPMDLQEAIPPRHVVGVVHGAIDRIPDATVEAPQVGGGRPPHHPKLLVYACTQRVYSSRQIAKAAGSRHCAPPASEPGINLITSGLGVSRGTGTSCVYQT